MKTAEREALLDLTQKPCPCPGECIGCDGGMALVDCPCIDKHARAYEALRTAVALVSR